MRSIKEEDITLVNIYTPNRGGPRYVKQILIDINGKMNNNIIIIGEFNSPLTSMERSSRKQINKETLVLHHTLDRLHLIDIYSIRHLKRAEYAFFSSAHGMLSG